MKTNRFIFSLLLIASTSLEAQNIIPNPSFETAASCPSNNIFTAANWYSPSTGSPDYFNPCGTGWTIPGPSVLFGSQTARTGSSFAAVGWYGLGGGWYEYIQVQFTTPMVAGEIYYVSAWVNFPEGVMRAGDDLGFHISMTPFKSTTTILPTIPTVVAATPAGFGVFTTLTPQIKCADGNFITDVTNWTEISGTYTATGGEQAITIGCFEPWTTTGQLVVNAAGNNRIYYYVDDVSVQRIASLPLELLSFTANENQDNTVDLNWETLSEENVCYFQVERSQDGVHFQGLEHVDGSGTSSNLNRYSYRDRNGIRDLTYYRLKTTDCDGKTSFSELISVKHSNVGVEIYPNPVVDELHLSFEDESLKHIAVYDAFGSLIFQSICSNQQKRIPFSEVSKGTYLLEVQTEQAIPVFYKVVKQ